MKRGLPDPAKRVRQAELVTDSGVTIIGWFDSKGLKAGSRVRVRGRGGASEMATARVVYSIVFYRCSDCDRPLDPEVVRCCCADSPPKLDFFDKGCVR